MRRRLLATGVLLLSNLVAAYAAGPLTTASEIKRLSADELAVGRRALLRGVVTQVTSEWGSFSLQDATDGIYVASGGGLPAGLEVGQRVVVEGLAVRGNFAPSLRADTIKILGSGRMPAARPVNWQDLASGACDNNYVEVRGVVRSAALVAPPVWEWQAAALRLDIGGNLIWTYLRDARELPPGPLVDSTVRVRGVCLVFSNSRRQFQGVALGINRTQDLTILQPGPQNPFDAPAQPIRLLFGFRKGAISFHGVKVQGVATLPVAGGVYIQDGAEGMLVRTASTPPLQPGDRVEAVGFPAAGGFATVLEDALIRVQGHGPEPAPRALAADKILARVANAPAAPNAVLLQVTGRVMDRARTARDETLILSEGGTTFSARLPAGGTQLDSVQPGSRVAVTGVCTVQVDDRGLPNAFELVLRSPADVRLLQRPPWITRGLALRAAAILLTFLMAAMVGLWLLRRRVSRQRETIRLQYGREASLQRRYTELVENASDLVYVRDLKGRLLQVNRGAEEMTGYTRAELLSMNILDLLAPGERERAREQLPAEPRGGGQQHKSEWRLRTRDGRELIVEIKPRYLVEDGQAASVECIGRDITARHRAQTEAISERNRLQEQLHHSQKLDSVGRLAGGVAHDFNNLLTVISGYAHMVLMGLPPEDRAAEAVREIVSAADRATALTRQLLLFSRRQKTLPSIIPLNELLANLEKMLRRLIGEDINLVLEMRAVNGRIFADPGLVEQVVMNLVVNARDAMPDGGTITIQTRDFQVSDEYAGQNIEVAKGDYVVLEVIDSGCGMTEEVRQRIFEPFFTTKDQGKGTGLGLSIVYGIVKQSGGAIVVNSEMGRGTVMQVLFPAAEVAAAPAPVANERPSRDTAGTETILVAEDETGVRSFIRDVLRPQGYTVLEAVDGVDALQQATRYAGPIHLLLTDIVMPRMGGVALAEHFAALRPGVPILHMSGYTDRCGQIAPRDILQKPFAPAVLLERVRQQLPVRAVRPDAS